MSGVTIEYLAESNNTLSSLVSQLYREIGSVTMDRNAEKNLRVNYYEQLNTCQQKLTKTQDKLTEAIRQKK